MSLSSADIKFGEVLPEAKDHSVFDVTSYASKITGGKRKKTTQKRNRKVVGGDYTPLQFSEFSVGIPAASINHPAISSALGEDTAVSTQTATPANIAAEVEATATTTTTVGGSSAAKRRQRKSKRASKKGSKKSNNKSAKKYSRRRR